MSLDFLMIEKEKGLLLKASPRNSTGVSVGFPCSKNSGVWLLPLTVTSPTL